jgi:hypothetical protein
VSSGPRAAGQEIIDKIQSGFEERGLAGRWEIFFPPVGGDFEVRGEGLRLIVEVNYGVAKTGVQRSLTRMLRQGPIQARLRAWFLNEFVERIFDNAIDCVPVIFSIIEAHRPSGLTLPSAVSGAPELDSADRPSKGADD